LRMNHKQERKRLRAKARQKRDNIPPAVRSDWSQQIIKQVIDWIETNGANAILLYLSMRSEVETNHLFDYLLNSGKVVLAPVMDLKQYTLTPHRITDAERDLVVHPYGMHEPNTEACLPFPLDEIDLITVPGLAFDRQGYRIGYGGGFYDRFLPQCPQAVWIGLAYEAQITADALPQAWDVPLHQIATEKSSISTERLPPR